MKKDTLALIKCPYCGSDFQIIQIFEGAIGLVNYGIIKCSCNEFPILGGILLLKEGLVRRYAIGYLRAGMKEKAIALALGPGGEDICRIRGYLGAKGSIVKYLIRAYDFLSEQFMRYATKEYRNDLIPFFQLHEQAYFKYRFAAETLWISYPFINPLKIHKKRILELGCGRGHVSFIISRYVSPDEFICADETFKSLYILKKYFSKTAQCICLNANYSLPFHDGSFDAVIMSDSFHYVLARSHLAKEMVRVKSINGLILLLHLHNSLRDNIAAGYALTPQEWTSLFRFEGQKIMAFPEGKLIEDFLYNDMYDLSREYSDEELNLDCSLTIMVTHDTSLFKKYSDASSEILNTNGYFVINPIYKIEKKNGNCILTRSYPSDLFKLEYPFAEKYMPNTFILPEEILAKLDIGMKHLSNDDGDAPIIKHLIKNFIAINVPETYL